MQTGETALIKASACGHTEVVDALIEAGTIMNLKKTNGYTALAVAILNQQHKVVNNLLLAGADPTIKDRVGFCYLYTYVREPRGVPPTPTPPSNKIHLRIPLDIPRVNKKEKRVSNCLNTVYRVLR